MTVTLPVNCGGELTDAAAAEVVAAEALAEPVEAADEPLLVVAAAEATLVVVDAALALALLLVVCAALLVTALLVAAALTADDVGATELLNTAVELPLAVAALPPPPQAASRATEPIPAAPCKLKMSRRRRLIPLTAIPFLSLRRCGRTRPALRSRTLGALQMRQG